MVCLRGEWAAASVDAFELALGRFMRRDVEPEASPVPKGGKKGDEQ